MTLLYEKESFKIRDACFKVWKEFGGAHKEVIVDKALTIELRKGGLTVEEQKRVAVYYEGQKVGVYVPDKVVNGTIILKIKAKPTLTQGDIKQFWHYLKGTDYK
jgi:GxxExxY protein